VSQNWWLNFSTSPVLWLVSSNSILLCFYNIFYYSHNSLYYSETSKNFSLPNHLNSSVLLLSLGQFAKTKFTHTSTSSFSHTSSAWLSCRQIRSLKEWIKLNCGPNQRKPVDTYTCIIIMPIPVKVGGKKREREWKEEREETSWSIQIQEHLCISGVSPKAL